MKWVGLTGGIATGKSAVAKILRDFGRPVVDADILAREVTLVGTSGHSAVVKEFGEAVLLPNGELHRKKLAEAIFSDAKKRLRLEQILHPLIQEGRAKERLNLERQGCELAFYDVPLLFEKNLQGEFDAVVLVYASPAEQKRRLMERNQLDARQASERLAAQMSIEEKVNLAQYVILNTGSISDLKLNVQTVLKELTE